MSSQPSNFEHMTTAEFEARLPELFESGKGRVSDNPELQSFLQQNPTCAALVRDLEYIAEFAEELLKTTEQDPGDNVWNNITAKMAAGAAEPE